MIQTGFKWIPRMKHSDDPNRFQMKFQSSNIPIIQTGSLVGICIGILLKFFADFLLIFFMEF